MILLLRLIYRVLEEVCDLVNESNHYLQVTTTAKLFKHVSQALDSISFSKISIMKDN